MALNTTGVYKPPTGSTYTREAGATSGAGQTQPEQCPQGQRLNAQTGKCESTDQPYASQLATPTEQPPPPQEQPTPEQGLYDPQPQPAIAQPPPTASDDVWNTYYASTQPQGQHGGLDPSLQQEGAYAQQLGAPEQSADGDCLSKCFGLPLEQSQACIIACNTDPKPPPGTDPCSPDNCPQETHACIFNQCVPREDGGDDCTTDPSICKSDQTCVGGVCTDPVGTGCVPSAGFGICLGGSRWNAQTNMCCHDMGGDPNIPFCPDGGIWHSTGALPGEGYCAPAEEPWDSGAPETWEETQGAMPTVDDRWTDINRQRNITEPGQVGDIEFEPWMTERGGGEGGYLDALRAGGEAGVGAEYGEALRGIAGQEGLGAEAEQEAVDAMSARIDQQYAQAEEELIRTINEQAELAGGFMGGARIDTLGKELGNLQSEKLAMKNEAITQMGLSGLEREITRQGQQIEAAGTGAGVELQQQEQHRKVAETWGGFDIQEKQNMMDFMLGEYQVDVQEQLSRGELSVAEFNANVAENLGISEQQLQASGKDLEAAAMAFDYILSKSSDERDWRNFEFGIDQFLMQMDFYRSQQLMNLITGIL